MKDMPALSDSVALLHTLCVPTGIRASRTAVANYAAVFARDAIMAGTAGLITGDAIIIAGLRRTLELLRTHQGAQGQIASNVTAHPDGTRTVSFGTLAPRFDSASWYLVGVALLCRAGHAEYAEFRESVERVIALLEGIEYNGRHLLYVPAGGNWADEYPFDGYILYDQVLRGFGLRLLADHLNDEPMRRKAAAIGLAIGAHYWPDGDWKYGGVRRFPVAAISPVRTDEHIDLAACALLALSDLAPTLGQRALDAMTTTFVAHDRLPPAFTPVIGESDPDWPALSRYHLHGFRNRPHEYHNGGIWPIWLGWLALAYAKHNRHEDAERLRMLTHQHIAQLTHFDFEEYFHGRSGASLGTPGMAYTATGLVFLDTAATAPLDTLFRAWTC